MYLAGVLYCCAAAVFWALGPVFLKKGLAFLDHTEMSASRTIGFAAASLIFCIFDPNAFILWRFPSRLLLFVFLNILVGNVLGDLCYFKSLELIGVSRAVGTTCCYPLFVTAISFFWLGESVTLPLVLGTGVMIAGLFMLKSGGRKAPGAAPETASWKGFLLALAAAFCWAAVMVLQKWLLSVHDLPAASITLWRALFLFAVSWGIWAWRTRKEPEKTAPPAEGPPGNLGFRRRSGNLRPRRRGVRFRPGNPDYPGIGSDADHGHKSPDRGRHGGGSVPRIHAAGPVGGHPLHPRRGADRQRLIPS